MTRYTLRAIEPADRPVVTSLLIREWGAAEVVALSIGGMVDASTLPGLIAEQDGKLKPSIPEFGHDGIPIRDELELEFRLS